MGYMRHHAIIVTGNTDYDDALYEAHAKATEIFGELVTPIIDARTNFYGTFMVGPDGSKEGWDTSDDHDRLRATFIETLDGLTWAEVQYGDDDGRDMILRTDRGVHDATGWPT